MTDPREGARTAAPNATPLTGLALTVEPRRRYDPNTGKCRKSKWAALANESAEFLMREGRPAENIRSVIMTGQGRDFRFRRDIAWKDFPHIQRPIHDYGRAYIASFLTVDGRLSSRPHFNVWDKHLGGGRQNIVGRKASRAALNEDLAKIEEVLVVADPWDDRLVWEAVAPVFTVNPDVVVWQRPFYEAPRRVELDELMRLERTFRAHDHLIYNYTYNMIVLGSRARHAAARLGPDAAALASAGYHLFHEPHEDPDMDPTASFSPFAIAALQVIARTTEETVAANGGDHDGGSLWREAFSRLPFMTGEPNGEVFLNWTGSGKFKPWIQKVTQIHNPPLYNGRAASDHLIDLASLYTAGLVTIFKGAVVPTITGRAFLDIVGESVNDPDLLVRWRSSGDVVASEGDFPAIDRWLASKFRRLKRRVAALPSSPLAEAGHNWRTPEKNKLVVRGVRIDAAKWNPEERKEIAAAIQSANKGIARSEQSMGVIITDDPFEQEDVPVAFWLGRPLAIIPAGRGHRFQYNCNLDTSSIDSLWLDRDQLPALLRNHEDLKEGPGFVTIGTNEEEEELLRLPHCIPMENARSLVAIYFGKAVFPHELSKWHQNAAVIGLESQQNWAEDRGHSAELADAINPIWRYRLPIGVEHGFLVGMRVGFGVLTGWPSEANECRSIIEIPEASWKMPRTDLDGDAAIAADLSQTEAALWCGGANQTPRRVVSIRRDGNITVLELEEDVAQRSHRSRLRGR